MSSVFVFPLLDGRLLLDTQLSLDLKVSLGLCARKDAEGVALRKGAEATTTSRGVAFAESQGNTSRGVHALADGFACTRKGRHSVTQKRANASRRGRLRKHWRKGCAEGVFASL